MASQTELSRDLGAFAVFSISSGTMIGAGIFVLPGYAATLAGPAAILSFLIGGLIALTSAISVSELATGMPKAGGTYYFLSRTFGPVVGSIVGWSAYLGLVFKGGFALEGFGDYLFDLLDRFAPMTYLTEGISTVIPLGDWTPTMVLLLAMGGCVLLTYVNSVGANVSGQIQNVIVISLLGLLSLFVIICLFSLEPGNFQPFMQGTKSGGLSGVFAATGLIFVSFLGVVKVAAMAEEVHNPGRNLPLGIISSVVVITVLYLGVMTAVIGIQPLGDVADSVTPIADTADMVMGPIGGIFMAIAGIFATLSTGNAALMASSRFPFAMARDNLMTDWFTKISQRFQTPLRAILITAVLMITFIYLTDIQLMAKFGGVTLILILALINLAVIVLRHANPNWYDPEFRSPLFPWIQILGIVGTLALVTQMGTIPQIGGLVFLLLGIGWAVFYRTEETKPKFDFFDILRQVDREVSLSRVKVQQQQELDHEIVIGLPDLGHAENMVEFATWVASDEQQVIHVVRPREVPVQTDLDMFRSGLTGTAYDLSTDRAEQQTSTRLTSNLESIANEAGMEFEFTELLTHDADSALVHFCEDHNVDLMLLNWRDEFSPSTLRDTHIHYASRNAPCDVLVLKDRGFEPMDQILVSTGIGPYDELELRVARGLAGAHTAEVTLFHVVPPDQDDIQTQEEREYMEELVSIDTESMEVKIVEGESVEHEIIEEARNYEMLVMGATAHLSYRDTIFGNVPDLVAQYVDISVVLARKQRTSHRNFWRTMLDKLIQ